MNAWQMLPLRKSSILSLSFLLLSNTSTEFFYAQIFRFSSFKSILFSYFKLTTLLQWLTLWFCQRHLCYSIDNLKHDKIFFIKVIFLLTCYLAINLWCHFGEGCAVRKLLAILCKCNYIFGIQQKELFPVSFHSWNHKLWSISTIGTTYSNLHKSKKF